MNTIDIHTHGIGGYDTRTTAEEHIIRIAEFHGEQGVSQIIPTIYPATIKVMRDNMAVVRKAMQAQKTEIAVHGSASKITGLNLEGPFLNPSKCGALNSATFIAPTEYNLKAIIDGFEDIVKIITVSPELDGAEKIIRTITDMGIIVSMGHSEATYSEAEAGFNAGAKGITHIFNAMRPFHHREPGIAGFGLTNKDIYIEVIADPFHLHEKTLELIFNTKKSDRIILISDSVKEAVRFSQDFGVVDTYGRLLGGCMTIMESSKRLIDEGFDENVVLKCITENPWRYLYAEANI